MTRHATAVARCPQVFARGHLWTVTLAGLMLTVASSLAIGQTRSPDDTIIQTSTSTAEAPGGPEDTYRARVRAEMSDWRHKMQIFDAKLEAGGRRHAGAAEARLHSAWDGIEVEARNVQTANARDWERTKRAYQTASETMDAAWDKVRL